MWPMVPLGGYWPMFGAVVVTLQCSLLQAMGRVPGRVQGKIQGRIQGSTMPLRAIPTPTLAHHANLPGEISSSNHTYIYTLETKKF